ncbi:hypothetical protein DN752_07980 [Echinicola strongylocentroti]|uniref:Uncharacterized protein n=1 Tax=Echinicola strongylocentroti TaxID=1795355 RepID=A0A2Z4IH84_9BACT|nr:hypothetical protein DN752_07980 [Echinicola strongylocentroti]
MVNTDFFYRKILKRDRSKILFTFVVIAHSYGASTWLSSRHGFWYAMMLIAFNSALYIFINENSHSLADVSQADDADFYDIR